MADLLSRMTLKEKVAQLRQQNTIPTTKGGKPDVQRFATQYEGMSWGCIANFNLTQNEYRTAMNEVQQYMLHKTRLGIPIIPICEALHGPVQDGCTIFPQHIALGATFNDSLVAAFAHANGREAYALGARMVLTPDADVCRDLRWGRVEECLGEDPYLCARFALAEVQGIQAEGVMTCTKHFGAHGEPSGGLNLGSVRCGERELLGIHLYPFRRLAGEGGSWSFMTSYNSWNGVPNTSSPFLLTDILRRRWGFKGFVYADWGSVSMLNYFHHSAHNNDEAGAQALLAGLDMNSADNGFDHLEQMVNEGIVPLASIDTACARVLRAKFAMGLFDEKGLSPREAARRIHTPEHVDLSRRIAEESIVLLKNERGLLPLDENQLNTLAVIGPNADEIQYGDYSWTRSNESGITLLGALRARFGGNKQILYAKGCELMRPDSTGFAEAVEAARAAQVAIIVVGSSSASLSRDYSNANSGEGFDLSSLELTGYQSQLIRAVERTGTPVVLVVLTGRPFVLTWEAEHLPAILLQWYGGERQGEALANVLFGRVNPSGRLNVSLPRSTGNMPCYYNHLPSDRGYYHRPGTALKPGRDYVLETPGALYPFGYGLSYTTFEYAHLTTDKDDYAADDTVTVRFDLKNTGQTAGSEVAQVYVCDKVSSVEQPVKQLRNFSKVYLMAGAHKTIELRIPVSELGLYDAQMRWVVEPGEFEIQVGASSSDVKLKKTISVNRDAWQPVRLTGQESNTSAKNSPRMVVVSGSVTDVQDMPLAGAKVLSGTQQVETDAKGRFSLSVQSGATLTVRAAGYEEQHVALNGKTQLKIRMPQSAR